MPYSNKTDKKWHFQHSNTIKSTRCSAVFSSSEFLPIQWGSAQCQGHTCVSPPQMKHCLGQSLESHQAAQRSSLVVPKHGPALWPRMAAWTKHHHQEKHFWHTAWAEAHSVIAYPNILPPLGVFKERLDVVLREMVQWVTVVVGGWLSQVILKVSSNLTVSVILLFPVTTAPGHPEETRWLLTSAHGAHLPHPEGLRTQAIKPQWGFQTLFNRLEIRLLNDINLSF